MRFLQEQYAALFNSFVRKYIFVKSRADLLQECQLVLVKACRVYNKRYPFFALLRECLKNHFSHLVKAYYRPCRHMGKAITGRMDESGTRFGRGERDQIVGSNFRLSLSNTHPDAITQEAVVFSTTVAGIDPVELEGFQDKLDLIERLLSSFGVSVFRELVVPSERTVESMNRRGGAAVNLTDVAATLGVRRIEVQNAVKDEIRPTVKTIVEGTDA